jgi:hypothetical protein
MLGMRAGKFPYPEASPFPQNRRIRCVRFVTPRNAENHTLLPYYISIFFLELQGLQELQKIRS